MEELTALPFPIWYIKELLNLAIRRERPPLAFRRKCERERESSLLCLVFRNSFSINEEVIREAVYLFIGNDTFTLANSFEGLSVSLKWDMTQLINLYLLRERASSIF